MISNKELTELYDTINKHYFNKRLPPLRAVYRKLPKDKLGFTRFVVVETAAQRQVLKEAGFSNLVRKGCLPIEIRIDDSLRKGKHCYIMSRVVLVHEMTHVAVGWKANHGPKFRKEMKRLLRAGVLDKLLF